MCVAPTVNTNHDGSFIPNSPLLEDNGRTLLILNRISFCLVSDATDQSIAAALATNTSSRNLEIILSTNVPITPTQHEYAERLIGAINVLARDPQSIEHGVRDILALVARYASQRVHRKATLIIDGGNPFNEKEATADVLSRLFAPYPDASNIITAFNGIVALTPSLLSDDPKERLETLITIMDHSSTILASPLLLDVWRATEKFRDNIWLCRFYRRVHRLHFYQYGVDVLRDPKRKLLKRSWQFRPRWLPDIPPVVLHHNQSSVDHACDIMKTFGYNPPREEVEATFPAFANGELWNIGDVQTLYVHPEARMAEYITNNDVPLLSRTIGCSKRPCRACGICAFRTNQPPQEDAFLITAPTDKIQVNWMCPNIDDSAFTVGMDEFTEAMRVNQFKDIYELVLKRRK